MSFGRTSGGHKVDSEYHQFLQGYACSCYLVPNNQPYNFHLVSATGCHRNVRESIYGEAMLSPKVVTEKYEREYIMGKQYYNQKLSQKSTRENT